MTSTSTTGMDVTTTPSDEPDLTAVLKVQPPLAHPDADPDSYRAKQRQEWTFGMLEATVLELRIAGAWDGSHVDLSHRELACEVLVGRREDAIPWGYRPVTGHQAPPVVTPPAAEPEQRRRLDGWQRLAIAQTVLLVAILVLQVLR